MELLVGFKRGGVADDDAVADVVDGSDLDVMHFGVDHLKYSDVASLLAVFVAALTPELPDGGVITHVRQGRERVAFDCFRLHYLDVRVPFCVGKSNVTENTGYQFTNLVVWFGQHPRVALAGALVLVPVICGVRNCPAEK